MISDMNARLILMLNYLIGMRRLVPELFRGIQWGSGLVVDQTLAAARRARVECQLLETLHDLDRPEDLSFWAQTRTAQLTGKGRISVIIPALSEEQNLAQTLQAAQRGQPHEIIDSRLPSGRTSRSSRRVVSR